MSFLYNDYSSFRPHNHKSQREYHRKKNQQVVYVEKPPKNDDKAEEYHEKECKDNKKLNFYEHSCEKRKFNSKKYKEKNYIYYEPKILADKENHQQNKDNNDVFTVEENPKKSPNIQETNFENERKFLNFQPTIESAPSENFRVDREEKISISGKLDQEKKTLSRKSSNTIEEIINNVFDDKITNPNLYCEGDDFEMVQNAKMDSQTDWKTDFMDAEFSFQNIDNANIPQNDPRMDFQIWNHLFFTKPHHSHNNSSKMNQINFAQKGIIFEPEAYFKDLFPISFDHKNFPIFSLFIQRIPNHDISEEVWFYKDPEETVQGPFNSNDMDFWNGDGYFFLDLMIAWNQNAEFMTIGEFIKSPQNLIKIALPHANLAKYFGNKVLNYENFIPTKKCIAENKKAPMSFNSFSTTTINYKSHKRASEKILPNVKSGVQYPPNRYL